MDLIIEEYPYASFAFISGLKPITIDLTQSVKEKLKKGERLTNETALKIFKQIKWKSDIVILDKTGRFNPIGCSIIGCGL